MWQSPLDLLKLNMDVIHLVVFLLLISGIDTDYQLYEVTAFNTFERNILYTFQTLYRDIVFPNGISNEAAILINVLVKSLHVVTFETHLNLHGIQYMYISQFSIAENVTKYEKLQTFDKRLYFFQNWKTVEHWFYNLESNNVFIEKIAIAKTFEQRDLQFIKIYKEHDNPGVFIVGGEDGTDWASSAIIMNFIDLLLDEKVEFLDMFNFYFIPILNPDGYEHTHKTKMFWTKNKRILGHTKQKCRHGKAPVGVNLARNWFKESDNKISGEECNAVYIGQHFLSEVETLSLSYVLNNLALKMMVFINLRSFGQYITIPYGDTFSQSNNHDIVMDILKSTTSKVNIQYNASYFYGTTANLFYNQSGNMADWVKNKLNTPLVLTIGVSQENVFFPQSKQINNLQRHFNTILQETLPITKNIYGPLINSKKMINKSACLTMMIMVLNML